LVHRAAKATSPPFAAGDRAPVRGARRSRGCSSRPPPRSAPAGCGGGSPAGRRPGAPWPRRGAARGARPSRRRCPRAGGP
jgi:hypothetical protein